MWRSATPPAAAFFLSNGEFVNPFNGGSFPTWPLIKGFPSSSSAFSFSPKITAVSVSLLQALIVEEPSSEPKESSPANLVALKTQTTALRDQIYRLEREEEFKSGGGGRRASGKSVTSTAGDGGGGVARNSSLLQPSKATEKLRKKLAEVEAQLLLASPSLVFQVR